MILSEVKYRQIHNGVFVNVRLIHHNHAAAAVDGQSTQKPVDISQTNVAKTQCRVFPLAAMEYPGIQLNPINYASLLQACTDIKSLEQTHAQLAVCGLDQNTYIETRLVSMYALLGSLENARQLFDKICEPNVFAWNAMIRRYATNGFCEEALCFYHRMQQAGIYPDNLTFPFALRACAGLLALREGKEIHGHIVRSGYEADIFTGSALVNFYVKCGVLEHARQLFDKMSQRNVVSWTAMIAGYACNGHANEALRLFHQMQGSDVKPNPVTVASVLPAYADLKDLQQGEWIHDYIIRNEYESNVFVGTALINMYIKCGNVEKARQVFDRMSQRNLVSWTALIAGYAQNGHASEALALFRRMQLEGMTPDSVTMHGFCIPILWWNAGKKCGLMECIDC